MCWLIQKLSRSPGTSSLLQAVLHAKQWFSFRYSASALMRLVKQRNRCIDFGSKQRQREEE
jgi:hypothetical protein